MLYRQEIDHSDSASSLSDPDRLEGIDYHPTNLELIDYTTESLREETIDDPQRAVKNLQSESVTWLNVTGLRNVDQLEELRECFEFHPLVLEDILRPFQRPKVESYEEHLFIVSKLFEPEEPEVTEQISFVLGEHYLLTFQETPGDVFDPVRQRIREGRMRIRSSGPDYLAYELLDSVVDAYFPVLERISDELETIEDEMMADETERQSLEEVHDYRRSLLVLRRSAWSQREMLGQLQREDVPFINKETKIYLRDAYDHSIRILDIIETYREMGSSLHELHLTVTSNRMNSIMKVLTIIATIFIPLTFVAGVYGMNFNPDVSPWNMPELNAYWGYPAVWAVMVLIALAMLRYFRGRDWI
ncbi:MAG: magnesium/cobalt transporter CorA [bacterium]